MCHFYVIGSINYDLLLTLPHFPVEGETVHANAFSTAPGGKGANQAIALARLGNDVTMFGKVGNDQWGKMYHGLFEKEGVNITLLETEAHEPTGTAYIEIDTDGKNRIVLVGGANTKVDTNYIDHSVTHIQKKIAEYPNQHHIALFQLEIPLESTRYAIQQLSTSDITIILDPAPAPTLISIQDILEHIDFITPNESEGALLCNKEINSEQDIWDIAQQILDYGAKHVILKAGEHGAYYLSRQDRHHIPALQDIDVVDSTAAGDTFNAGFAHGLGRKFPTQEALEFANKVAGLATTQHGAQSAMPTADMIQKTND